jgi:macrocin-O-methyltransferase TylF-like protien
MGSDCYLDLMEKGLSGRLYPEGRAERLFTNLWQRIRHPYLTRRGALAWPLRAHTMIGPARLRSLRELVERTIRENVPGHYIETGIWRGGACILMRAILKAHGVTDRKVFCADSFGGLPKPSVNIPQDRRDRLYKFSELAVSEDQVRRHFELYDLLDDQVVFLTGWFRDTLPLLTDERFAVIRLDGDMYESTMDSLTHLYPRLSPGGFAIIDDYGGITACRKAVHDYLDRNSVTADIVPVDQSCVWSRKAH